MLIQEKVEQAIKILNEYDVDCWVTFVRESAITRDSMLDFLVTADVTWHSAFILTKSGETYAIVGQMDKQTVEDLGVYKNVSSYVYKETLEDIERKYQILDAMLVGTVIIIIIGVIIILAKSWSFLYLPAKKLGKTGIFILGSSIFSKPSAGKRANVTDLSLKRVRIILLMLFIIFTILFLIISIYLGLFQDLVAETGG